MACALRLSMQVADCAGWNQWACPTTTASSEREGSLRPLFGAAGWCGV